MNIAYWVSILINPPLDEPLKSQHVYLVIGKYRRHGTYPVFTIFTISSIIC